MKKFIVKDEDKEYEIEEVEEVETEATDETPAELSSEELDALKKLASVADKLIALIDIEKDEHESEPESELLDEDEDEDEEDEDEEVIDTDTTMRSKDSKKSFGAIEKVKSKDSIDDKEQEIAQAWANRYGGNK